MSRIGRSRRASSLAALLCLTGGVTLARADPCGRVTPAYAARRSVTIAGHAMTMDVFIAGSRSREEQDLGGHKRIVLHLPDEHVGYLIDPQAKRAVRLPPPPPPKDLGQTRVVQEPLPGGDRTVRLQRRDDNGWTDLTTTTCNAAGIMTRQTFQSFDPQGNLVTGQMNQTDIRVGPLPDALFRLPPDVALTP